MIRMRRLDVLLSDIIFSLSLDSCFRHTPVKWSGAAEFIENGFQRCCERSSDCASTGATVSAAAKAFCDCSHVDLTLAAQAHAIAAIGEFAKEQCHLNTVNTECIIDDSLAIFLQSSTAFHFGKRDVHVGQSAFAMKVRKRRAEQPHLRGRI